MGVGTSILPSHFFELSFELAEEEMSPKYVYEHFALLSRLLSYAVSKEYFPLVELERYKKHIKELGLSRKPATDRIFIFEDEETETVLEEAKRNYLLWLIISIIKETGMRRSEVLGLQWKHINFADGIITIEQS